MSYARRHIFATAALALSLTGCGAIRRANSTPLPDPTQSAWSTVAIQVGEEVQAGRYSAADRLLADFAARYPNSESAAEARVWRGLFRLDPANGAGTTHEAVILLDSALALPMPAGERAATAALRRAAAALEARPAVVTVTTPGNAPAAKPDDKARDEELARVKDELAKANAELERIKRRLAAPKP